MAKNSRAVLCKRLRIKVNGLVKTKINNWMHKTGSTYWPAALPSITEQINDQKHTSLPQNPIPNAVFNGRHIEPLSHQQTTPDDNWPELYGAVDEKAISEEHRERVWWRKGTVWRVSSSNLQLST